MKPLENILIIDRGRFEDIKKKSMYDIIYKLDMVLIKENDDSYYVYKNRYSTHDHFNDDVELFECILKVSKYYV